MKLKLKASRWYMYVIPGSLVFFGVYIGVGLLLGTPTDAPAAFTP